jgi:hypothetical protein
MSKGSTVHSKTTKKSRILKPNSRPKLSGSFRLLGGSVKILYSHWKLFAGLALLYGILNFILVQGFNGSDVTQIKNSLDGLGGKQWGGLLSSLAVFVYLSGTSASGAGGASGVYQFMVTITASLAIIWSLRQIYAGKTARLRDSYYRGMYPFIPFLLVLIVVLLQLLPAIIGGYLYNLANSGIAASGIETVVWLVFLFLMILLSLYWLSSSLLALYIICLPDMTPMLALRSARELVKGRRWTVLRKVIFLPVFLFIAAACIVVPVIFVATQLSPLMFFIATMAALLLIHSYMYRLYRELL